VAPYFKAI
jgi:hypothetical protein